MMQASVLVHAAAMQRERTVAYANCFLSCTVECPGTMRRRGDQLVLGSYMKASAPAAFLQHQQPSNASCIRPFLLRLQPRPAPQHVMLLPLHAGATTLRLPPHARGIATSTRDSVSADLLPWLSSNLSLSSFKYLVYACFPQTSILQRCIPFRCDGGLTGITKRRHDGDHTSTEER